MELIGPINYQEAFLIPGISPLEANSLKQIRQIAKSRINARGRPQRQQRLTFRLEYLGVLFAFAICALVAINSTLAWARP